MKFPILFALISSISIFNPAAAYVLNVEVKGIDASGGDVECLLFSDPKAFPLDDDNAVIIKVPAHSGHVNCIFNGVKPGFYAVSAFHDTNKNGDLDTNFFGVPKEQWGVSKNIRNGLIVPGFNQAKFPVDGDKNISIRIEK